MWSGTRDYVTGDQVLHNGGSNVNSIYIANKDITGNETTPAAEPQSTAGQVDWYLVRSGIVSVQGPEDTGPAGLTANDTLNLRHGAGITITREGANFTISQSSPYTPSDITGFGPGWAYSYFNLVGT